MKFFTVTAVLILFPVVLFASEIIDEINFGNYFSESIQHSSIFVNTDTGTNALGDSYRRMLNYSPMRDYGGKMTFTLKCDPVEQNYLTLKLWGSDYSIWSHGYGTLFMYLFLDNKQLGYRQHVDWRPIDMLEVEPTFPGRFYYTTYILPLSSTEGKTQIQLSLENWGLFYPYGSTWDDCQREQDQPGRGVYRAYIHTGAFLTPPSSEQQGTKPAMGPVHPAGVKSILQTYIDDADNYAQAILIITSREKLPIEIYHLSKAYKSDWCKYFQDQVVVDQVVEAIDYYTRYQNSTGNLGYFGWEGHGRLAEALLEMYDVMDSQGILNTLIDHDDDPETDAISRRQAYADFFKDGRDWLMENRRTFTNQVLYVNFSACASDKALRQLDPSMAWSESYALQVAKEAVGLLPFGYWNNGMDRNLGYYFWSVYFSDDWDYYVVTSKGLSRELGYVAYYGDIGIMFAKFANLTGNTEIKQQGEKFMKARSYFHFYDNDAEGYRAMRVEAAIGTRSNTQTGRVSYAEHSEGESPFYTAAVLQDEVSTRFAQEFINHNRPYSDIQYSRNVDKIGRVNEYIIVSGLPESDYRLPMSEGEPDFAWADEEAAVVAAKVGDIRFYAQLFFVTPTINNIARVHYTTSKVDRVANVKIDSIYNPTGITMTRDDNPAHPDKRRTPPPASLGLHSYHAGESLPVAEGPLGGLASFYRLEYGDFLIGMNCSDSESYSLDVPEGYPVMVYDLISKQMIDLSSDPVIEPKSTVVLYKRFLPADINRDYMVNLKDFAQFASDFWMQ